MISVSIFTELVNAYEIAQNKLTNSDMTAKKSRENKIPEGGAQA